MSVTMAAVPRRIGASFRAARGLRELALLAGLYVAYSLTRVVASDDLAAARGRAGHIMAVESFLDLDVEAWLNRATSGVTWLAVPMDYWYCALHYLVTPGVLGWLYLRRPGAYPRARNALLVASGLGLLGYLAFPTAPPRLMGGAYLDTLAAYADFGWWAEHASAPAGLGGFTNELAAMPSLHVGWAVWVAWVLSTHTRALHIPHRRLVHLYPLGTALVVVCTGNHWVLDAFMGLVVALAGIGVATHLELRPRRTRSLAEPATTGRSTR
jgi:hypothetical protein